MLSHYDDYDRESRDGFNLAAALHTIAPLRMGAGAVLFMQYALEAALRAWHFVWEQVPWPMTGLLASSGMPVPHILAPAAAFISIAVAVAWMLGFFTRLFSLLFVPVLIGAMLSASRASEPADTTAGWLFAFITLTLILNGSGAISLDRLFKAMSKTKPASRKLL